MTVTDAVPGLKKLMIGGGGGGGYSDTFFPSKKNWVNFPGIEYLHSKNCGVKITPPVLIEDYIILYTHRTSPTSDKQKQNKT